MRVCMCAVCMYVCMYICVCACVSWTDFTNATGKIHVSVYVAGSGCGSVCGVYVCVALCCAFVVLCAVCVYDVNECVMCRVGRGPAASLACPMIYTQTHTPP